MDITLQVTQPPAEGASPVTFALIVAVVAIFVIVSWALSLVRQAFVLKVMASATGTALLLGAILVALLIA